MTAHVGQIDWPSVAVILVVWTSWLVAGTLFTVWVRGRHKDAERVDSNKGARDDG